MGKDELDRLGRGWGGAGTETGGGAGELDAAPIIAFDTNSCFPVPNFI